MVLCWYYGTYTDGPMPVTLRLPHRIGIILPSRDRFGRPLRAGVRRRLRQRVEGWFMAALSGATSDRLQIRLRLRGRWASGIDLVVEEVEELWAYCTAAEFASHRSSLIRLAEGLCGEADQQAIAVLIDAGMEIVTKAELP